MSEPDVKLEEWIEAAPEAGGLIVFAAVSRFQGAPYRSTCLLQPTSSSLVNVTEWVSENRVSSYFKRQNVFLMISPLNIFLSTSSRRSL